MHLSSRLPKKNYINTLSGGYNSEERKPLGGGSNFKDKGFHHNTMGKKGIEGQSTSESPNMRQMNNNSMDAIPHNNSIAAVSNSNNDSILKLPKIKKNVSKP